MHGKVSLSFLQILIFFGGGRVREKKAVFAYLADCMILVNIRGCQGQPPRHAFILCSHA